MKTSSSYIASLSGFDQKPGFSHGGGGSLNAHLNLVTGFCQQKSEIFGCDLGDLVGYFANGIFFPSHSRPNGQKQIGLNGQKQIANLFNIGLNMAALF